MDVTKSLPYGRPMKIRHVLHWGAFLVVSAWLAVWVWEGLTATDQTTSVLPFNDATFGPAGPVLIGTAWGCLLAFNPATFDSTPTVSKRRATARAVARVVQTGRTGLTVNDVPQHEIYMRVMPASAPEFIGRLRALVGRGQEHLLDVGAPAIVAYDPARHDDLRLAEDGEAASRELLIQWRVDRGLLDARHAQALREGVSAPASVLEIRPSGRRRDGEVEVTLRVVVAPEGRQSWEAESTGHVAPDALPLIQVGSPVTAWYLPADPGTVALTTEAMPV